MEPASGGQLRALRHELRQHRATGRHDLASCRLHRAIRRPDRPLHGPWRVTRGHGRIGCGNHHRARWPFRRRKRSVERTLQRPRRESSRRRQHRGLLGRPPVVDDERRLQALLERRMPGGLSHGRDHPQRVWRCVRPTRHLQRLRLLPDCLPLRRHRGESSGWTGLEVYPLLRPSEGRPNAGLRQTLSNAVHTVRRRG